MKRTLLVVVVLLGCGLLCFAERATAQVPDKYIKALYRYSPVMRFDDGSIPFIDDGEHFFPIRVSAITNNPGNRLERPHQFPIPDDVIATRNSDGTGLNISWLRAIYPHTGGLVADDNDRVNERGNDVDTARGDASKFQNDPHYRDRIYGHIVTRDDGAWLQYWSFYYYNDFPLVNVGDHEGDWEMVQVFVNRDAQPTVAVYAQHNGHTKCPWARVPKQRGRPVVYVARGSHASYFHDGHHGQDLFVDGDNEKEMRLIRIGSNWPRWVNWPGYFGGSEGIAGEFHSPNGPKKHNQFLHPQDFLESASLDDDCK